MFYLQSNKFRDFLKCLPLFLVFLFFYMWVAWLVSGSDKSWEIDYIGFFNVFYGDDAYRFFLARSAWLDGSLYAYNYMLPANLVLEGAIVSLANGDLFGARVLHAALATVTLYFIWRSGRLIGIKPSVMLVSVAVMGFMPVYGFVSLSFYGEFWLAFLLSASVFFFLKRKYVLVSILFSVLPLVRPEGIFFLIPLWLFMVREKNWLAAVLMLLPGFLYGAFLFFSLPDPLVFGAWRIELRKLLEKVPLTSYPFNMMLQSYSWLYLLIILTGFFYSPIRKLWPFMLGSFLWLFYLIVLIALGLSDFETRYTYSLIPVMSILFASGLSLLSFHLLKPKSAAVIPLVAGLIIIAQHFIKMDPVRIAIEEDGLHLAVTRLLEGNLFDVKSEKEVASWKVMAENIESLLKEDEGIDKLIMFDAPLYYYVDPGDLPENVQVSFPAMGYLVFHVLLDGQIFSQHPGGNMYSYFKFGFPSFDKSEKRLLYAGKMPMPSYPYRWDEEGSSVFLFSYNQSLSPDVDLESVPPITRERLRQELSRWTF